MAEHLLGTFADGMLKSAPPSQVRARFAELGALGPTSDLFLALAAAKNPAHFAALRDAYLALTEVLLREAVGPDDHLIGMVNLAEELDHAGAQLAKRLRDWYAAVLPELGAAVSDHARFVELVATKTPTALQTELGLSHSMGRPDDARGPTIQVAAAAIHELYLERGLLEQAIEDLMRTHCPNVLAVAGAAIGSKLLRETGGLARLSAMRAGTIQLLGAERALFRHLRNKKARPPKHGLIINHPLVARSREKGKAARAVADKLAIAAKVDYFKGQFVGDQLRRELDAKFP